jgi:hypothetical protein
MFPKGALKAGSGELGKVKVVPAIVVITCAAAQRAPTILATTQTKTVAFPDRGLAGIQIMIQCARGSASERKRTQPAGHTNRTAHDGHHRQGWP